MFNTKNSHECKKCHTMNNKWRNHRETLWINSHVEYNDDITRMLCLSFQLIFINVECVSSSHLRWILSSSSLIHRKCVVFAFSSNHLYHNQCIHSFYQLLLTTDNWYIKTDIYFSSLVSFHIISLMIRYVDEMIWLFSDLRVLKSFCNKWIIDSNKTTSNSRINKMYSQSSVIDVNAMKELKNQYWGKYFLLNWFASVHGDVDLSEPSKYWKRKSLR
jgi:hypothetical protein